MGSWGYCLTCEKGKLLRIVLRYTAVSAEGICGECADKLDLQSDNTSPGADQDLPSRG